MHELANWRMTVPSDDNNFAITWATLKGYSQIVEILLSDNRIDPSVNNNYAIKWASQYGHVKIVKLLLSDARVGKLAYGSIHQ